MVGYIQSKEKHPDADKLNICQVDIGEEEPVQIVCGAPNVDLWSTRHCCESWWSLTRRH